ncbi:MAG TPA: nitrate/nitrite transporter NrtS [Nitrolancea sp.]|nr:nitrate/nitrite transporter NrtS [Nitrolancea sp.]
MDEHPPPRRRTFQSVAIILVDLNRALHRNAPLLRRSLTASFVVGTVLVMINQGPALLNGDLHHIVTWRVPLNYVVPFCVATWGALSNRHR